MHDSRFPVGRAARFAVAGMILGCGAAAHGGLVVPAYSSRPGAAYTVYLDFGGFNYNGTWGIKTPGVTPAYSADADASTFSAADLANIQVIWADTAEKYATLDVNVTTVDPAVAAGKAGTDAQRKAYYDNTARVQHTVIGGTGAWYGSAGGVSFLGELKNAYPTSAGQHTNWVFAGLAPTLVRYVAEAAGHENGHAFGLDHQSDYGTGGAVNATGTTLINEYSTNGTPTGGYAGDGTFAPTMGDSYYTQRGLWRSGASDGATGGRQTQNDYSVFATNPGLTLVNDGVGHTLATATALPLAGREITPATARGILTPASLASATPLGVDSYTKDYFAFSSTGGQAAITAWDGGERIQAGVADMGLTADAVLKIYDLGGTLLATSTRASDTASSLVTALLAPGSYYLEVSDIGGYTSTFDASATYYTGGSYFLTGVTVPEPAMLSIAAPAAAGLMARRRRA